MIRKLIYSFLFIVAFTSCDNQAVEFENDSSDENPADEVVETIPDEERIDFFSFQANNEWTFAYDCFQELLDEQRSDTLQGQITWTLADSLKALYVTNYFITEHFSGQLRTGLYGTSDGISWKWTWGEAQDTSLTRTMVVIEKNDSLSFSYQGNKRLSCLTNVSYGLGDPVARSYPQDSLPGFEYFAFGPNPLYGHNFLGIAADTGLVFQSQSWTNRKTRRGNLELNLIEFN
ncbi:MAG: hypothetical protein AB8G77_24885 [Rhodothermales bacterium]